jgi:hypothetical protein
VIPIQHIIIMFIQNNITITKIKGKQ